MIYPQSPETQRIPVSFALTYILPDGTLIWFREPTVQEFVAESERYLNMGAVPVSALEVEFSS